MSTEISIHLPRPHAKQAEFMASPARRRIIKAGRRSGKTVGVSTLAVQKFVDGHRILYATPTMEQIGRFWTTVTRALQDAVKEKIFKKNEAERYIELPGTEQRIKAKAQPLTAKVYTPNGPKFMRDIMIGDEIMTPFGTVTNVIGVYPQDEQDIYEITFGDGCKAECTLDHLWEVRNFKDSIQYHDNYTVVTTKQLLENPKVNNNNPNISCRPHVRITEPVVYTERPTPVDPYLLGVLIGDGTLSKDCSPRISTSDTEILNTIKKLLPIEIGIHHAEAYDYRLAPRGKPKKNNNPLLTALKTLGLIGKRSHEKFVPVCYKYNSKAVRLKLIQGILDTDGTVSGNGRPMITQTSKQLADDIAEIIQSLGGLCSTRTQSSGYKIDGQRRECKTVYRQYIIYNYPNELFTLQRKRNKLTNLTFENSNINRSIRTIKLIRRDEAQCIKVADERHLYLTNHFIITHNTAWNADSLRGDYADVLILDEFQLMNEDTWNRVGAPMLLDNDGDAVFVYTPPSLRSRSASKASDPQHAPKLFKRAMELMNGGSTRWAAFHFNSMDNPYLSEAALDEITTDMTSLAYRMEILAEDVDEAPGALWTRKIIDDHRVISAPDLYRIVVAVDPSTSSTGNETGIIVAGKRDDEGYVLEDRSLQGSPLEWAKATVTAYHSHKADMIIGEKNQGGEMVETTIHQVDPNVPVKLVHASRGKQARAEPISAKAEKGKIHHVGNFPLLEDELVHWIPGDPSPNRLDAMVWGMTELIGQQMFGDDLEDVLT